MSGASSANRVWSCSARRSRRHLRGATVPVRWLCFRCVDLGALFGLRLLSSGDARLVRMRCPRGQSALCVVARVIPAAFAVFELRYLLASLANAGGALEWAARSNMHSASLWLLLLLAAGACWMLREIGRDLVRRTSRPRWSLALVCVWLLCSSALVALFCCELVLLGRATAGQSAGVPAAVFGPAGWSSALAALSFGFLLAASLQGVWRVLREVGRIRTGEIPSRPQRAVAARLAEVVAPPAAVPLLAGWSDRGPPVDLPLAAV